jgi:hypothetical protein
MGLIRVTSAAVYREQAGLATDERDLLYKDRGGGQQRTGHSDGRCRDSSKCTLADTVSSQKNRSERKSQQ